MRQITQPRFLVFLSFVFLLEHIRLVEKYSEEVNSALEKLGKEDGWRSWRKEESLRCTSRISTVIMIILIFIEVIRIFILRLTKLAQERISKAQNPSNCKNAKKLVCHLNYACGFGCQVPSL